MAYMVEIDLSVENVSIEFGSVKALENVSIAVPAHGVVGVIGPNGAGKSTLLAVIGGQATTATGSVTLFGRDITGLSAAARARIGLRRTFQSLDLFDEMTVRDNVLVAALAGQRVLAKHRSISNAEQAEMVKNLLDELGLSQYQHEEVHSLSAPIRRMISYCRAIVGAPRFILLDEPAAGLSQPEREAFAERIRHDVISRGHSLIVVEHDMGFVRSLCDTIYVLDAGKVIASGTFDEIAADPHVREAYLGGGV